MMRAMNSTGLAMKTFLMSFARDESGATAIEYGLIAALIAVGIVTPITTLGLKVKSSLFDGIATALP